MNNQQRQYAKRSWIVFIVMVILLSVIVLSIQLSSFSERNHPSDLNPLEKIGDMGVEIADSYEMDQDHNIGYDRDHPAVYIVVIDAGHGGHDPGASGVSGQEEKEFTLTLAQKIVELLGTDDRFQPILSRSDDTFFSLMDRAQMANGIKANALISIHGNTFTDFKVKGTETYYWTEESRGLANIVHQHIVRATGFQDRGVRKEDWKVLVHSEVTAILAEIGYMTNKDEEQFMLSEQGQQRIAEAIVEAVKSYFIHQET